MVAVYKFLVSQPTKGYRQVSIQIGGFPVIDGQPPLIGIVTDSLRRRNANRMGPVNVTVALGG